MKRRDFLKLIPGMAAAPVALACGYVPAPADTIKPGQLNVAWDPAGGPDAFAMMMRDVSLYGNGAMHFYADGPRYIKWSQVHDPDTWGLTR